MRKNDRFEQELNVVGAARRAKAFGIKTMTVVVTVAMLVSGVPTRVIAEGLQEAGVIAAQDSTDQSASNSGQQAADQAEVQDQSQATDQSNTQEQSQAASEQAAQPSAQDNAAAAQNDSPSAQPAPSAQPSQQTATADIALTLNNASITYKGQVVAQPAQKVTAPTSDNFEFTVQPDNGYKLSKVTLTVSGTDRELKADANGVYTVDAADVAQSPRITLETEQEKTAEPAKEATPIEDAEGVSDDNAAADQSENKKSDEKDVNAVDAAAPADAKAADCTVEVGETRAITGNSGYWHKWTSSDSQTATVSANGENATVTGKKIGTVTITHKYKYNYGWFEDTLTVQVTPVQPKISGADTVKMGESTTFTVSGFEQGQTVQWKSENSNVATVDASGNVTGVHVGKTNIIAYTNNQSVSKQIEVKRDDLNGGYYVYLYTKAEGNTDGLALTVNSSGWYTIGRVWVAGIQNPAQARQNGKSQTNESFNKTIAALQNPDNIDLYGVNSINLSDIDWHASGDYGITLASGANDYPEATGTQWHLDGYVKFDYFGSLIFHYKDAKTKDKIAEDYTTTAKVTDENFDFSSLKISIAGYTYDHADPELVKVEKNQTKEVTLYYNKGTFPYTVKYLEKDTGRELRTEKSGAGEYGSTVTEDAADIDGYELADGAKRQQSIQLGTEGNVITFYYKKSPASYTVNYYWNGTTDEVADSKTVSTGYVNDEVTEDPIDVDGFTPVSAARKTITLVKGKNEINFYYYKNVELTANSKTVPYNGEKQSVSGFTVAPKGADFSAIEVAASGTNAGTYPANFAEGTVGKVDKTEKYIVANATNGKLVINPVTKQVVITITGHNGGEKYNGEEQSVSGYDVSGLPEGMTKDDIACAGKAEAKGTNADTYDMGLKASQFSLTGDAAENFTNVTFKVTDGKLTIAQRQIWRITPDGEKNYDGAALVCKGDLNANKYIDPQHESDDDGFVDGEGFAGKEDFTWREDAVLPGEYDNVVTNISYKNGTEPKNYDVHIAYGKLKINEPSESEKHEITITANSSLNNKYDGKSHSATGFTASSLSFATENGVVTYTLKNVQTSNPTEKNAGYYDNTINNKNNVKVVDEKDNDVTALVKLKFVDGVLAIQKRNVTLVSESKNFEYDGRNHSCEKVTVDSNSDGFAEGEGVTYKDFATIKNVGIKDNSFDFDWGTAAKDNYTISKKYGTLNVTKGVISKYVTLNTVDVSETYDGNRHIAGEATATDENGNDLKIEYQKSDGTWTTNRNDVYAVNVGDSGIVNVRVSSPANYGEGNYVTGTEKLVVNPVAITLTAKSDSKPYDGIALTNNGYDVTVGNFVGDEGLDSVTVSGSQTEVGRSDNLITAYELKKNTKADNYNITTATGVLEVTPFEKAVVVKIKGNSATKTYNGQPQSVEGYKVVGISNDKYTSNDFELKGSAKAERSGEGTTYMGLSENSFVNKSANFSKVTFQVTDGYITIKPKSIVPDPEDHDNTMSVNAPASVVYNGQVQQQEPVVKDGDKTLVEGTDYTLSYSEDATNVGTVKVTVTGMGNYTGKAKVSYLITPAPLSITTDSDTKVYDGTPLTARGSIEGLVADETVEFKVTGSQTLVGWSKNTYELKWNGSAKESNYTVKEALGKLEVSKQSIDEKDEKDYKGIKIDDPASTIYDGSKHQWTPTVTDADGNKLTVDKDYEVAYKRDGVVSDDFKNAGTITVVISGKGNYSGTVTKKYEITKRAVTLTSADHTWTYDGKDHQETRVSVTRDGFAAGEGVDYSDFATVKDVTTKAVENTFTYAAKKGTDLEKNYNVKVVNGKLTVTKAAATGNIVLTTKDESKTYDGHALEAGEAKATATTGDDIKVEYSADHKTWTENRSEVALTNAGSKTVYVRASSEKNFSGFVEATETLTVDPATVTIATKNAEKPYDGKALTADGSMTGLVNGETAEFKVTGTLTDVGEIANAYTLTWNGTAKKSNYIVKETVGKLKVTARSIDDTTYGMSVSKPESVEYDGQAHKWAPTVKDGEKTLAEGTDYTVAYGKDDFTNVTGEIKVTVTGKGNYAGSVERTYQVTPAPLTVETEGASKTYDGEALTHDVATIKGLKNKETATIHATGSQTEVGESDNGYAITWDGSAQKDNYTIKTETIGKLVVSETADQITATPVNVETTYDGSAHGTTVQVTGLPKGYTVKKAESKATATDVADGEVKATVDELVIMNAQGKDVTSKLNIKRGTATIKINPAPLTVTTDGGEKEYDGTALTANGIKVEGLKGKDSVSAKTTGSRTKVGSSNNTYEINWKDTKKSNYKVTDVLGTLKVTPSTKAVTLTSGSASHAYSGRALTSDEIKAEGLPEGFTVKAKMDGAQTDAGSSKNTVKSYKILDAKGDDVTDMFANVTVKTGTLTVSPKKITVETEGATKVYDGQELTNKNGAIHGLVSGEHADVVTNGTQTNVGSSDNGYTIAWGTAKEGNYTIASDTLGKLVVTPQSVNPNDPSYRKLQVSNPADLTYDGQTHKWAPEVKDYTGTELKEGVDYTFAYNTDDFINAGSITVTVVGKGNYTGTVSRTYRIKPAPVSIKTESAARVYNGKALTAGGAITGLVNGETVDFRVTGSQTKVGHSANTYKLAWTGTAREANYAIASIETGTLTVTESEDTVVVTTTGGIFTYDGKAHGATVAVSQLPEGYTVDGTPSSDATATDVNGDGVKATVDHLVIRNAEGEDVTSKLNIKKVDGTIKVLPAELTVTTDSATKVYDGTALTAGATPTGLVGDEEVTLEATGKQTQVGSSSNGYKLTFDKTAKAKNYKVVSENLGTLTVTKQSIVPSEPGTPSDNYKGVTVDDPKDAVYDGVEHKWTPVVKDAEGKALIEDTDYVVSYDTDDFIDVATINVTITGKGNYTGTIVKSYRITKAPLHVVTGSATKFYDGTALTSATFTIDGLAERDRIGIAVTGSQTNVGSSQNTYAIDWMQTSADNYELTDELGTLTVAAAPARPTTPSTPTTPATPTVPNPTPNSSDGGSTATTSAPTGEDSAAGNDQEQKEEKIFDAKNPLGKFDGKKDTCWVHWYMIICAVATAAYGLFVGLRRDKHSRRLQNDLDKVLGNDDETQE